MATQATDSSDSELEEFEDFARRKFAEMARKNPALDEKPSKMTRIFFNLANDDDDDDDTSNATSNDDDVSGDDDEDPPSLSSNDDCRQHPSKPASVVVEKEFQVSKSLKAGH